MAVARQTEAGFMATVIALARLNRFAVYHTHDSRRSPAGFPDLVLVKPPRVLFVELKTDKGRTTAEQDRWLALLRACGLDARLWRPSDWYEIEATLTQEGITDEA